MGTLASSSRELAWGSHSASGMVAGIDTEDRPAHVKAASMQWNLGHTPLLTLVSEDPDTKEPSACIGVCMGGS